MEKIMKKILTAVLSLAMVACFVPQTGMQAYAANDNQETMQETMDVTIVKKWIAEDGLQLECLFDLYRSVNNGEKEKASSTLKTLTSGVDWQYTFESVPKSDSNGNKYEYEVVETIYSVKEDGTIIYPGFRSEVRSSQQSDTELKFTVTNIQLQPALQLVTNGAAPNIPGGQGGSTDGGVWFGNYMQSSADTKEPVKWRVLQNADGKLLLLSDQNLDCKRYNESIARVTWENSTIRKWLNNDFKATAFSTKEVAAVAETNVINELNPAYSTPSGENTKDDVFLLSIGEAKNTAYGFTDNYESTDTRVALNTDYAKNQEAYTYISGAGDWWLRSPGAYAPQKVVVRGDGTVHGYGRVENNYFTVRPAFNLNLGSVLFTSAAEGGKSSGVVGAGSLEQVGSNSNGEWKLTLESGHDSFKVDDVSTCDGKTVNIEYSGAVAKKGEYISAIVEDEDDAVKYYGNLIEFADGDSTQGTAKVTIDGKMESTDKLYVFNEQLNGDKKTDYSSALHIIDIPLTSGHKYGAWAKLNAIQHQKVCENDKTHVVKENHKWDAGKVTKKATEKQAGVKTYTCTVCKATKTETIPKLKPQPPTPTPSVDKAAAKTSLDAGVVARSSGSKVTASWGTVKGASSYVIYANYCDRKTLKKIRTVSGKTTSIDVTKLNGKKFNPKKNLKFYVVAYQKVNGKKVKLARSIMAHAPGSKNSKRTNVTGVKVKKASFTLKKGKTAKIKGKLVLEKKNRKPLKHCAKFRYASSNKKVAKVSKKGKITAVGKGKCTVYVYAVSGVSKKIKVTVK